MIDFTCFTFPFVSRKGYHLLLYGFRNLLHHVVECNVNQSINIVNVHHKQKQMFCYLPHNFNPAQMDAQWIEILTFEDSTT